MKSPRTTKPPKGDLDYEKLRFNERRIPLMSIYGGPAIETDGLGMKLDAANKKSYDPNLESLDVEYLIVAGGGGGVIGGGGGAGGLLNGSTTAVIANGDYTIVIGGGGSGGTGWNTGSQNGKVGSNSSALSVTSSGGGGGRHYGGSTTSTTVNGGSGGGGANGGGSGGTGISGQGNNGGGGGTSNVGAGGGGAGTSGGNANHSLNLGGHGGIGKYFGNLFGNSVGFNGWFSDGGGGGVRHDRTRGLGSNGAGDGGNHNNDTLSSGITNASVNTGSGGGGAGYSGGSSSIIGGNGGSGIVIIRYLGPQKAAGGDIIFSYEGYTVHVFSSSGTFTVGEAWGDLAKKTFKTRLVNSPSHNNISKGVFYFDGTNQYIRPSTPHSYLSSSSIGLFFKVLSVNIASHNNNFKYATLIGYRHNGGYSDPTIGSLIIKSYNNGSSYNLIASLITASQAYRSTSTVISLNQWYHAVLVKDTVNGIMSIYLNGEFKNSVTFDAATYGQWTQAGQYIGANILDIGKSSNGTSGQGWANDYFNGYISNIRLYTRVLNDNEIMKNFRALKGRFGL